MSAGQKKRQKKLERRSAKRKQRQKTLVKHSQRGLRERLAIAATAPVLHSEVTNTVEEDGLGHVLLSRELPNGNVAYGMFLVDLSCMGVKKAFGDVTSRAEYNRMRNDVRERYELILVTPAELRQLVEGVVQYANDLGLEPHADYARIKPIFGAIDPSEAEKHFQFGGSDGKPYFNAGPNEGPERCQQIMGILEHTCGEGGFHFTIPVFGEGPESLRGNLRVMDFDEDGDSIPE